MSFNEERMEELFDQADQNGDGYLCHNEFVDWLPNDPAGTGSRV